MSHVQNPTYLLAPNWTFRPGGRIALGNIIADPMRPHRPLTKADAAKPLEVDTATEMNWQLSRETTAGVSLSVWATFLEKVHLKAGTNRERVKNLRFTMTSLDTVFLKEDPSNDEIIARCNDPDVREFMRLDSVLCHPVYLITGLKIAKGFALQGENSSTTGYTIDGGGEATPEVSMGASLEASSRQAMFDQFEAGGDIIFAYQLLKLKPKGWTKQKTLSMTEFQPKQAFLGSDESRDEKVEAESDTLELDDLEEAGSGVHMIKLEGHGNSVAFVVYEQPIHR